MFTCDDDTHALRVVLGTASTPKHLHHIQRAQLLPVALGWVIHLGALDDDCVGGQIYSPRQGGCGHQHLQQCNLTVTYKFMSSSWLTMLLLMLLCFAELKSTAFMTAEKYFKKDTSQ